MSHIIKRIICLSFLLGIFTLLGCEGSGDDEIYEVPKPQTVSIGDAIEYLEMLR